MKQSYFSNRMQNTPKAPNDESGKNIFHLLCYEILA